METMLERIDAQQKKVGLSDRALSLLISENRNDSFVRDMRRKGMKLQGDNLARAAEALETTVEYLRYGKTTGAIVGDKRTGYDPGLTSDAAELPRDIPVYGTALGSEVTFGEDPIETHQLELTDAIDWARRPLGLQGRRDVYALYITGSSMEPRFEPGDPVIVDPKRPPRPGDDVIVQIREEDGDGMALSLVKRLVRRTASHLELRQYNPATTFLVPVERVKEIHRVVMLRDLIS